MDICSTCGQEVRFGVRNPTPQWPGPRWLHRDPADDADHIPTHGKCITPEQWATIERNKAEGVAARSKSKKAQEAEEDDADDGDWIGEELPEPELRATDVQVDELAPRSGMRQIANLIGKTDGWELRRLTRARGPWMGARGQVLSISDSLVLAARSEEVDGVRRVAVASWRDGKFHSAYVGTSKGGRMTTEKANATDLKNWIKRDLSNPLLEPRE